MSSASDQAIQAVKDVENFMLNHFAPDEFGEWWPDMSTDLLKKLDRFRELWGYPVEISPVDGSRGRHNGPDGHSMHNIDRWGVVRAVDVFPKVPDGKGGYRYMQTVKERQEAYATARVVGFTGIGLYVDTHPGNLLHVDNRPGEHVATWSRVNHEYLGLDEVLS